MVEPKLPVQEVTLTRKPLLESDSQVVTVETASGDIIQVAVDQDVMKSLSPEEIIAEPVVTNTSTSKTAATTETNQRELPESGQPGTEVQSEVLEQVQSKEVPKTKDIIEDTKLDALPVTIQASDYVNDVMDKSNRAEDPLLIVDENDNNNEKSKTVAAEGTDDSSECRDFDDVIDPPYSPVEFVEDPVRPGLAGLGQVIKRRKILDGSIVNTLTEHVSFIPARQTKVHIQVQ